MLYHASGVFGGVEERRCSTCSAHWVGGGGLEDRAAYTRSLTKEPFGSCKQGSGTRPARDLKNCSEGLQAAHMTFWTHIPYSLSQLLFQQTYMGKQEESEDHWRESASICCVRLLTSLWWDTVGDRPVCALKHCSQVKETDKWVIIH